MRKIKSWLILFNTLLFSVRGGQHPEVEKDSPTNQNIKPGVYPYDQERNLVCTLQALDDSCELEENMQMSKNLSKSSWWSCPRSGATDCFSSLVVDLQANLDSCTCGEAENPTQPAYLKTFEALSRSKNIFESDAENNYFTPGMELLANLIIHKARYCVFDVEAYGRLVETVHHGCN